MFDSSGEPACHPDISDFCAPGCSGTEFEVGRITSCEDVVGATVHAPMGYESEMNCRDFGFCIRRDLGRFHLCYVSGPIDFPAVDFGEGDISTEAEMKSQKRLRLSTFSAFSAKCISPKRFLESRLQPSVVGAGL